MTGGGKNLKNQEKSYSYICNFLKKFKNLYQKLTFTQYDRIGGAGPSAQDDSEVDIFKYSLTTVCREIKKIIKELKCKLSDRSTLIPPAGTSCKGSILIEFAICMPVLIILLFYIHDLVKIKRYYSQTEFVAQQMANIIQNIAKKRVAEGQAVAIRDVVRAAKLAYLSIYPGTTMYRNDPERKYFHVPRVFVYYVEGDGNGKASCKWGLWIHTRRSVVGKWNYGTFTSSDANSTVTMGENVDPSSIYPTLKINEKSKVIIETQLSWSSDNSEYTDVNGKKANSAREAFGCFLVTPKLHKATAYFPSVVIFTPYGGFSKTVITGA